MSTKLGQNFLIDAEIARKIVHAANIKKDDIIVEVGPGTGAITTLLSKKAKEVYAIELDQSLVYSLEKKYAEVPNVHIIHGDILTTHLEKFLPKQSYTVVANVPYYITSKITRYFLEQEKPPVKMVLMVQKEVAQRITAQPGNMSILSVSICYYATPSYLFTVAAQCFDPIPKVDSAVIKIISKKGSVIPENKSREHFFRIVKAGFSAKRKTLSNNLANGFHTEKKMIIPLLEAANIAPTIRAQELSLTQWQTLAIALEKEGFYDNDAI